MAISIKKNRIPASARTIKVKFRTVVEALPGDVPSFGDRMKAAFNGAKKAATDAASSVKTKWDGLSPDQKEVIKAVVITSVKIGILAAVKTKRDRYVVASLMNSAHSFYETHKGNHLGGMVYAFTAYRQARQAQTL